METRSLLVSYPPNRENLRLGSLWVQGILYGFRERKSWEVKGGCVPVIVSVKFES
jgi:hypothetical protein